MSTIADLKLAAGNRTLTALITVRERRGRLVPDARVQPGDVLVLEGEQENVDRLFTGSRFARRARGRR